MKRNNEKRDGHRATTKLEWNVRRRSGNFLADTRAKKRKTKQEQGELYRWEQKVTERSGGWHIYTFFWIHTFHCCCVFHPSVSSSFVMYSSSRNFFCCMLRSAVPAILNRQQPIRIDRKKTCSRYRRGSLTALNKKTASLADSLPDDDVDVAGEKCRQHPADIRSRLAMIYFISPYFLAIPSLFPSPCLAIFFTQTLLCPRTVHFSAGAEKVVQFKLSWRSA